MSGLKWNRTAISEFGQKHTSILLAAGLFVLAVICASSYFTFQSYFRSSLLRKHSFLTLNAIHKLLAEVTDAETGQRGYLLTGRDNYLEPYQTSVLEIPRLLAELRRLRESEDRPAELLARLEQQIKLKFDELNSTVQLRRSEGLPAALQIVNRDVGKRVMDEIRRICEELVQEETDLLNASDAAMNRGTGRAMIILFIGTALTFALVVGAGVITSHATRKRADSEAKLVESVKHLALSNRDLEQFAYVASHDLQEPLRMVSNYCQLLGRRYKGRLDADADEFIQYAVDGAQRMQRLIDDLLAYSRVGSRRGKLVRTPVENAFREAVKNLETSIQESGATITHDALPELEADPNQLTQLLQNLLGNAIKFRGKRGPQIHVSAEKRSGEWLLGVHDDGIGIAPEYREQIFVIFQRLNSKQEYPGTGIGLAICKKIMDTHGGKIWVEPKAGPGTTFYVKFPRTAATSTTGMA
ncbi:MAG: CHASE3 domain-containing protein [Verrucomicrobiota bacterium]